MSTCILVITDDGEVAEESERSNTVTVVDSSDRQSNHGCMQRPCNKVF